MLQHIVEEGSHLGCIKARRGPLLCPQSVLHEIGKVARIDFIDAAGGHTVALAVKALHRLGREFAPGHGCRPLHAADLVGVPLMLGKILPEGALPVTARYFQSGDRRTGPIGIIPLIRRLRHSGQQGTDALHHKGGAQRIAHQVRAGPGNHQPVGGLRQRGVEILQFNMEQFHAAGSQFDALLQKLGAVLPAEKARIRRHRGQHMVVGAQKEHTFDLMTVVAGDLGDLHLIQRHGDGTHIVLGEKQLQQTDKFLPIQRHLPQCIGKLIHHVAQKLPELTVLPRLLQLAQFLQRGGAPLQLTSQIDLLQKGPQHPQFSGGTGILLHPLMQAGQRFADPAADGIDPLQLSALLLRKALLPTIGVGSPVLPAQPHAAVDIPPDHVVFQRVALLVGDTGQSRLQPAEHILVLAASSHRIQRAGDQTQHRLFQNIAAAAEIDRHAVALKHIFDGSGIVVQISGRHSDVTEAVLPRAHQRKDPGGHILHLGEHTVRPVQLHLAAIPGPHTAPTEEISFQMLQGILRLTGGNRNHPAVHTALPRQTNQALLGANALGENLFVTARFAQKRNGNGAGTAQQNRDDLLLLGGKVGKAVQKNILPGSVPGLLQPLHQLGHQVAAVAAVVTELRQIGGVDDAQFPDLVGAHALQCLAGIPQLLRQHTAAFQLIAQLHQFREEWSFSGGAGIDLQGLDGLLQGKLHHQQLAASIQRAVRQTAHLGEHAVGQKAETQHLRMAGSPVSADPGQIHLRQMGGMLRHQQNLLTGIPQFADLLQHSGGFSCIRSAHPNLQHGLLLSTVGGFHLLETL